MVGNPFSTYINRDNQDTYYHHRRKLMKTRNKQTCDLRLVKQDGLQLHAQLESVLKNEMSDNDVKVETKGEVDLKDWHGSGTILIVDDEETVCAVGKQMLKYLGFNVLTAPDGHQALKVFRENADEIVCVLLDLTMPLMDGKEAFRALRHLHPGVKVILSSGYNEQDAIQRLTGIGLAGFIQKPYNMATLKEKLAEVLAGNESASDQSKESTYIGDY